MALVEKTGSMGSASAFWTMPQKQKTSPSGTFKLTTIQPSPLPRDSETVVLRFELD